MLKAMEEKDTMLSAREYPIADAVRAEVLQDYVPEGEFSASQLVLKKGDILWVLERHPTGWWAGHKEGDDLTGWFPRALVRPAGNEEGDGGLGDKERCSPSTAGRGAEQALFTCDHRAVASPQTGNGGRRRLTAQSGADRQQDSAILNDLQELSRRLEEAEKELIEERRRAAESAEAAAKVQAELELLRQDRERERQAWEQERQQYEKRAREWEARRLQEEMLRREIPGSTSTTHSFEGGESRSSQGPGSGPTSIIVSATAAPVTTATSAESAVHSSLHDGGSHLNISKDESSLWGSIAGDARSDRDRQRSILERCPGQAWSAESRGASAGASRRLFPHATTVSLDGSRTPPTGPSPVAFPVAGGSVSAPTMPTIAAVPTMPLSSTTSSPQPAGSLSARHGVGQPPRPTPRNAATAPPWMATTPAGAATVGVPSSPRHRPRQFAATAAGTREDGTKIEVRALVSAFERRSNSQGAPQTRRAGDPSPVRPLMHAGSAVAPSRAPGSSSRAASREDRLRDADDEPATPVNFGMSPIQRQQHVHRVARQGMLASSSSPPSKAPISVQDRIRQLNGGRFGR